MEDDKVVGIRKQTEEVDDIIQRMPNTFARNTTLLVWLIIILLVFFGSVIKYPDIVVGDVTISAEQAPLQIVAIQNGNLKLNHIQSQDSVEAGGLLAWIDGAVKPSEVKEIKNQMDLIVLPLKNARAVYNQLPKNLHLGELTLPYLSFLTSLSQISDYQDHKMYDQHAGALSKILVEQDTALKTLQEKENLNRESLRLSDAFLRRDSLLLVKRFISQAEYEQSKMTHLMAEDQFKSSVRNSSSIREQISNTNNSIQQNKIARIEKELQLNLELLTAYNNLIDKINNWEKQYTLISPISGKVQFLKFWNNNQFVQTGEPIFSIIPDKSSVLGKVVLPVQGAGKVQIGQKVIVKMADYPYMEYGYVEARVNSMSLISSPVNLGNGKTSDSYLVTLAFPEGLNTNYGTSLNFRFEAKGTAEIITRDRRLIERFFDNLKYIGYSK